MTKLCRDCDGPIEDRKEQLVRGRCRNCYNTYQRNYYKREFKSARNSERLINEIIDQDTCGHGPKWMEAS